MLIRPLTPALKRRETAESGPDDKRTTHKLIARPNVSVSVTLALSIQCRLKRSHWTILEHCSSGGFLALGRTGTLQCWLILNTNIALEVQCCGKQNTAVSSIALALGLRHHASDWHGGEPIRTIRWSGQEWPRCGRSRSIVRIHVYGQQ